MKSPLVSYTKARLAELFSRPPYATGVALSGGGARGFAHVGVLQALHEARIHPDIVAGVSAGAVAAVFYASGIPFDKMLKAFDSLKFNDFAELSVPKDGFFKLDRFRKFLRDTIPYKRIEDLPVKTVICATDIDSGESVAFEEGPLPECVAASCSIPIVFKPAVINGVKYVDGGLTHNLPAWAIRSRCRTLYGINVSPMVRQKSKGTLIDIATKSFKLMAKNNAIHDMQICDHVIELSDIAHYNIFNLNEIKSIYKAGYETTKRAINKS
ncbi:MAG: patatin-like phospholipase family protein [Candidatus Amulumruptor sp.]|mgnify:FL=1|jgi:hypothetical protein